MESSQSAAKIPTRFISAAMAAALTDFIKSVVILKGFSVEDIAIISLVASEPSAKLGCEGCLLVGASGVLLGV